MQVCGQTVPEDTEKKFETEVFHRLGNGDELSSAALTDIAISLGVAEYVPNSRDNIAMRFADRLIQKWRKAGRIVLLRGKGGQRWTIPAK